MKTSRLLLAAGTLLATGSSALGQWAIDWSTIDGGGRTVAAGNWELSGTIGQPDASEPVSADEWTLTGGFWSVQSIAYPCA
jgi:hypothetical protein